MFRFKFLNAITVFSLLASGFAFADTTKNARKNDVADSYILADSGDLFRMVKGNKCQITNNVSSFKVSQHPNDLAMIYFEKGGDLYMLRNTNDRSAKCPKANKTLLLKSVKKYSIIPNTKSIIVNIAQSTFGELKAWSNDKEIVSYSNVSQYKVNPSFGKVGDPNADTIAYIIDNNNVSFSINGKVEAKPTKVVGKTLIKFLASLFNIAMDVLDAEPEVSLKAANSDASLLLLTKVKSASYWQKMDVFLRECPSYARFSAKDVSSILKAFSSDRDKDQVFETLVDRSSLAVNYSVREIKSIMNSFDYSDSKQKVLKTLAEQGKVPTLSGSEVVDLLSGFSHYSKLSTLKSIKRQIKSINGQELIDIVEELNTY